MEKKGEWKKRSLFLNAFHYERFFLFMSNSTLWEFKITKTLFIVPFPCEKLNLKSFVFVAWVESSYLFCSVCALHVGFLSFQCGSLARQLHTLQVQPGELHGDQQRGLRPCGESCFEGVDTLAVLSTKYAEHSLLH